MHSRDVQMRVRMTWASGAETRATSLWPASKVCSGVLVSHGKGGKKKCTPICAVSVHKGAGKGNGKHKQEGQVGECICAHQGWHFDCNQPFRLFFEALVARSMRR